MLRRSDESDAKPAEVYLVGAGPGDPDLLTIRALRLMQKADVVLHDRLIPRPLLDLVRREAERMDVGKRCGAHTMSQDGIGRLMVRLARSGRRVLRLKNGDPFIFGRGGEEIETLAAHGIPFQVVPGITAATGCAAYAGIPLTHREHAQSCVFVTGHRADGRNDLDWLMLARPRQTVVVYMGLGSAATIAHEMIAHGAEPERPAAIIVDGTRASQRMIATTLADLPAAAESLARGATALIVIGEVVRLAPSLSCFTPATESSPVPAGAALAV
jgi:uroporphyrin-III C-methyltransferase/precorrin-2 dehydrogenase/sirohydrochlorin ferrochelatase